MTKQEEIREGIAEIILKSWGKSEKTIDTAYDITSYLHSQGVVIKGLMLTFDGEPVGFEVEPLIGEK